MHVGTTKPVPRSARPRAQAASLVLSLRVENLVALVFFLADLSLEITLRMLRRRPIDATDVSVVISAILLLFLVELVNYLVSNKGRPLGTDAAPNLAFRAWRVFHDWFPFVLILLMYYSLWGKATLLLVSHDRDVMLLRWDKWLFGAEPTLWMQRFISPPLTAWMQFAYAFHLYLIPLVALFIYLRRPRECFRETMCGLVLISAIGIFGYMIVPAIGPEYTLASVYTIPLSQRLAIFNLPIQFMNVARITRDCFPSLHVGLSFLVWLYAWRNSKRLFWILCPLILSLWISTVYLRYHYAVDCIAGFTLAPFCYLFANWLYARCAEIRLAVPLPKKLSAVSHQPSAIR